MTGRRRSIIDLMEAFADVRIDFWTCPVPGHSDRRGYHGEPVVTVEWDGDVARCTAPDCGRTNQTSKETP